MITKMKNSLKKFWADDSAQGMLEYVLLAVAIVTVLALFKNKLKGWFDTTSQGIDSKVSDINSN